MSELLKNKRILIVVAHPDDELLGLGATMHRLINDENVTTRVVILGEGITSRSTNRSISKWKAELKTHKKNIYTAAKHIGYHYISFHNLPDNRFDSVNLLDIIKIVEDEKMNFKPDVVFTHHGGDLNIDHRLTFQAVLTACRPLSNENVRSIFTFETPSGTEWRSPTDPSHFLPNFFMSISQKNIEAKIRGMEAYTFEKRPYPHPRSPEALTIQAKRIGIIVGEKMAEAFCLIRHVH
jgi:LmbE family N-acetylglucosaminyl deacetylase